MAVKFIEGGPFESEMWKSEVMVRCACGCSVLNIKVGRYEIPVDDEEIEPVPLVAVEVYGTDNKMSTRDLKAHHILLGDPEQTVEFLNLIERRTNDGTGVIWGNREDSYILVRFVDETCDDDVDMPPILELVGFSSKKNLAKYLKAKEGKRSKYQAWNVAIAGNQISKFVGAVSKIITKEFGDLIEEREITKPAID